MADDERAQQVRVGTEILQILSKDHERSHERFNLWLVAHGLMAPRDVDACSFKPWVDRGET